VFPIRDDNPTLSLSFATYALIGLNIAAWVLLQGLGTHPYLVQSICELGAVPASLLQNVPAGTRVPMGPTAVCVLDGTPNYISAVTAMFMHGGWLHLIGNMWFLAVFGDNVEDAMGHVRFVVFYLLCGFAALAAQVASSPTSTVPMVGASGAIGGVMGAYAVLYPRVGVHLFVFFGFFFTRMVVPAFLMLGYWFLIQLLGALPALGSEMGGVAFWAHAGGFVAGIALVFAFKDPVRLAEHRRHMKLNQRPRA